MGKSGFQPLQNLLDRRPLLDVPACAALASALLGALGELHARGEIQHSIDPRAVLVVERRGGTVFKIYELGLRHLPDPSLPRGTLIRDGQVLVNLRYVSPELIRRRPLDARHDLFVVGIVLFQCLTGAHPFEARDDLARMEAIMAGLPRDWQFPPGRDAPALVAVVRRLLATDPADRPATGADAQAELLRAVEGHGAVAGQASPAAAEPVRVAGPPPPAAEPLRVAGQPSPAAEPVRVVGQPSPAAEPVRVAPAAGPRSPGRSGVLAIAPRETLEAGSFGLHEVTKETVGVFMERVFRGRRGTGETDEPAHLVLPAPVVHPFAMGHADSPLSLLLDLPDETLWELQLVRRWIVVRAEGNVPVRAGQVITEGAIYLEGLDDYPDAVECRTGANAIEHLLATLDLRAELERARAAVGSPAWGSLERAEKRLALLERYLQHGMQPASLMLPVLPIVPRALRMLGTPGADLDALYHGVLQASTRLSLMHKVSAPVMVERNQRENLTRCIEALFANGRGGRLFTAVDGSDDEHGEPRPLASLSELLRSLSVDISGVFEGHRVSIEASDEVAAALRGVALRLVAP